MMLSSLQRFILKKVYLSGRIKVARQVFIAYYEHQKNPPQPKIQVSIITQSLERLIDKGLVIGFGRKTQEKLFIDTVQLTAAGKKVARKVVGQQISLPFPTRSKIKK